MNKMFTLVLMAGFMLTPMLVRAEPTAISEEVPAKAVEVGNKICPVSGEKVGEMGKTITIEHNGKVYNLCCAMCVKDFNKDPQKFAKIAEDEVAATAAAAAEQK